MRPKDLRVKMDKVVLDANVFVSFLISHQPPISTILDLWARGELMVCYSPEILDELEAALKYPKIRKLISSLETESLINAIKILGILIIPAKTVEICRDKKDNKYLEVCLESASKFLISGDKDLLALGEFEGTKIVSPYDFGQVSG